MTLMARTQKFRRARVLIVGCGDVGRRCVRHLGARCRVLALVRDPDSREALRAAGITPLLGDLDAPATLRRLRAIAPRIIHLAPPRPEGREDCRTRALANALNRPSSRRCLWPRRAPTAPHQPASLARAIGSHIVPEPYAAPPRLVYASTTGVYGDRAGGWVDETFACAPASERARRRVSAERQLRELARRGALASVVLRVPGIYAEERLPLARLRRGTPALIDADDVYTNHIHADDLARIVVAALWRAPAPRVYNASDDSALKMGEYFDRVADAFGLPRAERISREQAETSLSPTLISFMSESRRISNRRMKAELRISLRYPTVDAFLRALAPSMARTTATAAAPPALPLAP